MFISFIIENFKFFKVDIIYIVLILVYTECFKKPSTGTGLKGCLASYKLPKDTFPTMWHYFFILIVKNIVAMPIDCFNSLTSAMQAQNEKMEEKEKGG